MNNSKRRRLAKAAAKITSRPTDLQVISILKHRAEIAEANKTLGANNRRERRKMGYTAHV